MARRKIVASEVVNDIRSGMEDVALMEKYKLSTTSFISALEELVRIKAVTPEELQTRSAKYADSAIIADMRNFLRRAVPYPVPVFAYSPKNVVISETVHPESSGILGDVSENGICAKGIDATADEVKSFTVSPQAFDGLVAPFDFQAKCIWTGNDGPDSVAGFEITRISAWSLRELRKLIELIELENS